MPSDFLNGTSEYRPMRGMKTLLQIFVSPRLDVHPGLIKNNNLAIPSSRPEMNWQDANALIRLIHGAFLWCGVLITLVAGHCTKKEAKYNLDTTFTYRHISAQEQVALSKSRRTARGPLSLLRSHNPVVEAWHIGLTSTLPKGWQEGRYRSGPLSMLVPQARMGIIPPESPKILTMRLRRNYKMSGLNLTVLTPAQSGLATLPFVASAAQWRIGT